MGEEMKALAQNKIIKLTNNCRRKLENLNILDTCQEKNMIYCDGDVGDDSRKELCRKTSNFVDEGHA